MQAQGLQQYLQEELQPQGSLQEAYGPKTIRVPKVRENIHAERQSRPSYEECSQHAKKRTSPGSFEPEDHDSYSAQDFKEGQTNGP